MRVLVVFGIILCILANVCYTVASSDEPIPAARRYRQPLLLETRSSATPSSSHMEGDKGLFHSIFGIRWAPIEAIKTWWSQTKYSSSIPSPNAPKVDRSPEEEEKSLVSRFSIKSLLDYVDDSARYTADPSVPQVCSLVDSFGWWVQASGGVFASSVLILKWRWEQPRRPWTVWLLDSVKNGASQLAAHFIAVFVAGLASESVSSPAHVSPCSWYLWVFIIDVTVGVTLAVVLLKVWEVALKDSPAGHSGDYGQVWDPESGRMLVDPDLSVFWSQMGVWLLLCVVPSRIVCGSLVAVFADVLLKPAAFVSLIFQGHPRAELVFVLLIGPVVMNALQFLIQDAFLSHPPPKPQRALLDPVESHTRRHRYMEERINTWDSDEEAEEEDRDARLGVQLWSALDRKSVV